MTWRARVGVRLMTWRVKSTSPWDLLPAELGDLSALKTLDLAVNQLTSVPPGLGKAVQADPSNPRCQRLELTA